MNYKQITTVEKAFEAKGMNSVNCIDIAKNLFQQLATTLPESEREGYVAYKVAEYTLEVVISAINGGYVDISSGEQYFYNYFTIVDKKEKNIVSGRGLSLYGVYCDYSFTTIAPCFCFLNREGAAQAAEFFLPQYEAFYLNKFNASVKYGELLLSALLEVGDLSKQQYEAVLEVIGKK